MQKQTVKTVLRLTTSFGTGIITGSAIVTNVPQFNNPLINLSVRVAGFMIGGMAGEATGDYSDRFVDQMDELVKQVKQTAQADPDQQ